MFSCLCVCTVAENTILELKATPIYPEFVVGESIQVDVILKNAGQHPCELVISEYGSPFTLQLMRMPEGEMMKTSRRGVDGIVGAQLLLLSPQSVETTPIFLADFLEAEKTLPLGDYQAMLSFRESGKDITTTSFYFPVVPDTIELRQRMAKRYLESWETIWVHNPAIRSPASLNARKIIVYARDPEALPFQIKMMQDEIGLDYVEYDELIRALLESNSLEALATMVECVLKRKNIDDGFAFHRQNLLWRLNRFGAATWSDERRNIIAPYLDEISSVREIRYF